MTAASLCTPSLPALVIMSTSGTSSFGGRLSTTYHPMSSTQSAAWERPAPDMPVMSRTSKSSAGSGLFPPAGGTGAPAGLMVA